MMIVLVIIGRDGLPVQQKIEKMAAEPVQTEKPHAA
jgi:hypothetical protein